MTTQLTATNQQTPSPRASVRSAPKMTYVQMFMAWLNQRTQPSALLTDPEDRRKAHLLAGLSLGVCVVLAIAFPFSMATSTFLEVGKYAVGYPSTFFILVGSVGGYISYRISRTPRYRVGAWLLIWAIYVFTTGFITFQPLMIMGLFPVWTLGVVVATLFLPVWGTARVLGLAFALSLINAVVANFIGSMSPVVAIEAVIANFAISLMILVVAVLREQDLRDAKRLRDLEATEHERLARELEFARRVQIAMQPKELPQMAHCDLAAYSKPALEASGDFYDMFLIGDAASEHNKLGIVVCDVAGKGVPSALVMSATRAALRSEAARQPSPARVLERVNEALANSIPTGLFATIFYAVYDPQTRELSYASAGHPHPYYYAHNQVVELENYGMPLGLVAESEYEDQVTRLSPGESVFIYTDGLIEAQNPERELFGFERVQQKVEDNAGPNVRASDLMNRTLKDMETFARGEPASDDVTLVVLRVV